MKKSVIIGVLAHKELKGLAGTYHIPLGKLLELMILYFKRTGIDPRDATNKEPSAMIKQLDKRLISFIKRQEQDILIPLRDEVFLRSKEQQETSDLMMEGFRAAFTKLDRQQQERHDTLKRSLLDLLARKESLRSDSESRY